MAHSESIERCLGRLVGLLLTEGPLSSTNEKLDRSNFIEGVSRFRREDVRLPRG
jgi:hypothetical protein